LEAASVTGASVADEGRAFTEDVVATGTAIEQIAWKDADFAHIAVRQQQNEDAAAHSAGPVLICDTDALATCSHVHLAGALPRPLDL
jgi:nicotinamide riboside kinase